MAISIVENRDCMEAMREFPDKFFDLAIVDPPYGIGVFTSSHHTDGHGNRIENKKLFKDNYEWNFETPEAKYFEELNRVSKKQIIWGGKLL